MVCQKVAQLQRQSFCVCDILITDLTRLILLLLQCHDKKNKKQKIIIYSANRISLY